jgi:hypothetical protein
MEGLESVLSALVGGYQEIAASHPLVTTNGSMT